MELTFQLQELLVWDHVLLESSYQDTLIIVYTVVQEVTTNHMKETDALVNAFHINLFMQIDRNV